MASDALGIAALVGLKIREISVTPVAIPAVKESLGAIDSVRAALRIERALECSDAGDVERIFRSPGEGDGDRREEASRREAADPIREDARR